MLTAFYIALTSKWRVEHSLFIQPRWACQYCNCCCCCCSFFLVLFIINFLKSLCFLLCCQLCASFKNLFFVPFAILVVQSSFEQKENALRRRYSYICTMQEKKVVFFHVSDTAINYSTTVTLLVCSFSKQKYLVDPSSVSNLPDGTPCYKSFMESRNHRFWTPQQSSKNRILRLAFT